MDELKKQLVIITWKRLPLGNLIEAFQMIEEKGQRVDNLDLDNLDRIYTKLLLLVPELIAEVEIFERLLKNRKAIEVGKKRAETVDWKKVYSNLEDAKNEVEVLYENETIELIKHDATCQMYKNATEAVAERIRAIKIFLNYANKQSFN